MPNQSLEQEVLNLARGTWEGAHNTRELNKNLGKLNSSIESFTKQSEKSSKTMTKLTYALVFVGAVQAFAIIAQVIILFHRN